jgi:alpha-L-fucosidase
MSLNTTFCLSRTLLPLAVWLGLVCGTHAAKTNDALIDEAAASIGNSLDGIKPTDPRAAWFREARYGLFVNWGLYTIPGGEWNGKTTGFAEYVSWKLQIPATEYAKIAEQFNPKHFDADQWAQLAQDAGMKYLVFDVKHHDGFAMYRSKVSPFNVCDMTPWKRDPVPDLQAACAKRGIKFCFYYSHSADWHEPDAGGYNTWDFSTDPNTRDFDAYFNRKAIPQIKELLANYGEIGYIWFDWPGPYMTPDRCRRMAEAIHALQPNTLINSRLGPKDASKFKEMKKVAWDFKSMGDNQVPPEVVPGVWETAATLNAAWGYTKKEKDKARTAEDICFSLVDVASKGGNYLLNVGPDADGVVPLPQQETLRKAGEWLKFNGEAIYGAGPTLFGAELGTYIPGAKPDKSGKRPFTVNKEWRCTTKPGKLYIHLFKWPADGTFELNNVKGKIKTARFLADAGSMLTVTQTGTVARISVPAQPPRPTLATVLVLDYADSSAFSQVKEADPRLHADGPGWRLDKANITNSSLPRLLFIGDSILQGYMGGVNHALKGKANVDFWVTPLWQSERFNTVLADVLEQGPYDVLHINIGLHGWPEGRILPGTYEPLTRAFLDVIRKKSPKTKVIWASSTPTFNKQNLKEFNSTINPIIVEHNKMANKIMTEYGIPINDFYALLVDKSNLVGPDGVHWGNSGRKILADVAVKSVLRELEKEAKK